MYTVAMISKSLEDTRDIAAKFAETVRPRASRAAVIALLGALGSGKTAFSKAFAAALGVREIDVTSPTFVIMKSYELGGPFKKLIHIDAYRLETAAEIEKLGWNELLSDPENLILIEWPENVGQAVPSDALRISFTLVDEKTREIEFTLPQER